MPNDILLRLHIPNSSKHHYDISKSDVNRHKIFMTDGLCDNMDDYFYSIDATLQYDFVATLLKPLIRGINYLSRVNFISSSGDDIIFIVFSYELIILWNPIIRQSRKKNPSLIRKKKKVGKKHNSIGLFEIDLFSTKSNSWKLLAIFLHITFSPKETLLPQKFLLGKGIISRHIVSRSDSKVPRSNFVYFRRKSLFD
ncbi:hypothetical protein H5410_048888 [Solanum commersonii]|uniref:Uncharacterized protein n=1 Tax=Solanum commersonii TaxID=4109 RepID=A0A9J5XN32_SOLCO|nr:hypothetical protein H5410_048888 [Solanum commersonii]